jgi:HTH-type transcriptional regulator/antitoxin HigA
MTTPSRLDFSKPHVLRTAAEYDAAVREIDALLAHGAPAPGTEDADRLQLLSVLVEVYENEHETPMPEVSPPELVHFMLEQHGMTRADLAPLMGGKARVSEFFSGRRSLSLAQVQRLSAALRISADLLLGRETTPAAARRPKSVVSNARATSVRERGPARTSTKKRKGSGNSRGRR